jgi:hypothetical protein
VKLFVLKGAKCEQSSILTFTLALLIASKQQMKNMVTAIGQ